MKKKTLINYDSDTDILYIVTKKGMEESTTEIGPGINIELDEEGEVIGIEILHASKTLKRVVKPLYQHAQSVGV